MTEQFPKGGETPPWGGETPPLRAFAALIILLIGLVGCYAPATAPFESPLPLLPEATGAASASPATAVVAAATASAVAGKVPTTELADPAPVTPAPDKGVIVGRVRSSLGSLPGDARAFVAKFVWNEAKTHGVFYLDPAKALSVPISRSGAFQIPDLDPGSYVLVIGVTPEQAVPIIGERNQARVIDVIAGQVTDLGEQTIELR